MTDVYSYAIATLAAPPPVNLEALTVPVNPPRSYHYPASAYIDRADGSAVGRGFPSCRWVFDNITQEMVTQLRAFCAGYSAPVIITTRIPGGTFDSFTATMVWPSKEEMEKRQSRGFYQSFEILFRVLVPYRPPS